MARVPQRNRGASSANGQLVDRFSKMSLTPTSQTANLNKKANDTKTRNISSDAKTYYRADGAIPFVIYKYVKEVADVMKRRGWPNDIDRYHSDTLEIAEYRIGVACRVLSEFLPPGWKYDRDHAISLAAGYRQIFLDAEGHKYVRTR